MWPAARNAGPAEEIVVKVAYLTNVIPTYRTDFFKRLLSDPRLSITVFCRADVNGHPVELSEARFSDKVVTVEATNLLGDRFVFERLPFRSLIWGYETIVSDGNPRHLGFALVSTIAALLGKRVVIWSTLHSRRNRPTSQAVRLGWWRIFPEFLSYTQPDADQLNRKRFGRIARSTNNGLDQGRIDACRAMYSPRDLAAFKAGQSMDGKQVLLSIGRAVPGRFDMMAETLAVLKSQRRAVVWILLGGGNGMGALREAVARHGVEDMVCFPGPVYEEAELARWFGISDLFVYTEAIGLSLYHAFGYGLPVVAHANLSLHGPEMGAFEEGATGLTFRAGDARDMAEKITGLLDDPALRATMGTRALEIVRQDYNSEIMYERFVKAMITPKARRPKR